MQLVKMKSDWIKVGSKSNLTAVLRKDTETHREECQVRTEAEIGVMYLQDKEWQGWSPKAQRQGRETPSEVPEGTNSAYTLVSDF